MTLMRCGIRIRINVKSRIRIRIKVKRGIQIRIIVKKGIRIRIKVMQIRNTALCDSFFYCFVSFAEGWQKICVKIVCLHYCIFFNFHTLEIVMPVKT